MRLVKLVTQDCRTRVGSPNETKWELGKPVRATGTGGLCSNGVIHAYRDEYIAAFMNPTHAGIVNPRCIVLETSEVLHDDGTKVGVKEATWTGEEISLPLITTEQRIEVAIRCALAVYHEANFVAWANKWLDGSGRSSKAAAAAYAEAYAAAKAAAKAAAAAYAAAYAAANAANAAAAYAAAYAAVDAARAGTLDLSTIIRTVLKEPQ